ncbi:MAG: polysaccharide deacetylase family protein [Proteobacteria bacterium]|nr:polysaccharide deacetylase family protein [Pseudomonadota bacterium]
MKKFSKSSLSVIVYVFIISNFFNHLNAADESILKMPHVFGANSLKTLPLENEAKEFSTLLNTKSRPNPVEFSGKIGTKVFLFGKDPETHKWIVQLNGPKRRSLRYLVNEQQLNQLASFSDEVKNKVATQEDVQALKEEDRPIIEANSTKTPPEKEKSTKCKVALTFDDGPRRDTTSRLMSFLKKNDVKASFFVTADNAKTNPDILQNQANAKHSSGEALYLLANHSKNHPNLSTQSTEQLRTQILAFDQNETYKNYLSKTGFKKYFRAPYGAINSNVLSAVSREGYSVPHVGWNVDSNDWKLASEVLKAGRLRPEVSYNASKTIANDVTAQILKKCQDPVLSQQGIIVLMHDIHAFSVNAVIGVPGYTDGIVNKLKDQVEFIRMNEVSRANPVLMGTDLVNGSPTKGKPTKIHSKNASGVKQK